MTRLGMGRHVGNDQIAAWVTIVTQSSAIITFFLCWLHVGGHALVSLDIILCILLYYMRLLHTGFAFHFGTLSVIGGYAFSVCYGQMLRCCQKFLNLIIIYLLTSFFSSISPSSQPLLWAVMSVWCLDGSRWKERLSGTHITTCSTWNHHSLLLSVSICLLSHQ